MRVLGVVACVCLGVCLGQSAWARDGYGREVRVVYLKEILEALSGADVETIDDIYRYINVAERNRCRSVFHRLRVDCLIEASRRICRGRRGSGKRRACMLISDLAVANKLGESKFLSVARRYDIMKKHRDYRRELRQELARHYGSLAAELAIRSRAMCRTRDYGCLAERVDDYCLETTEERSLSWQYCAAAVIWFIGTARASVML